MAITKFGSLYSHRAFAFPLWTDPSKPSLLWSPSGLWAWRKLRSSRAPGLALQLGKLGILTLICTSCLEGKSIANKTRLVWSGTQSRLTNACSRLQTKELQEFPQPLVEKNEVGGHFSAAKWATVSTTHPVLKNSGSGLTPGLNTWEVDKNNVTYIRAKSLF